MPRKRPVEYSILYTATLCLLAGGAVMVYSASSAESLLSGPGDPSYYLKRYVMFGLAGLVLLHAASRHGLQAIRVRTADEAARHGHDDGDLLRHRRAARGGGHADAQHRPDRGRARLPRDDPRDRRALPARAAALVPRPVRGRRRHRLPGGTGADRDRLGRVLRSRPRRVGPEDLLPARGAY